MLSSTFFWIRDNATQSPQTKCQLINTANNLFYLYNDGSVYAQGANDFYQTGCGTANCYAVPTQVIFPCNKRIKSVIAADKNTFYIDSDGKWYAVGYNYQGRLGLGKTKWISQPTLITLPHDKKIETVVQSLDCTFYKAHDGNWFGCGLNAFGELGQGHCKPVYAPMRIRLPNDVNIKTLTYDGTATFITGQDDKLYVCGLNVSGQLGNTKEQHPHSEPNDPPSPNDGVDPNCIMTPMQFKFDEKKTIVKFLAQAVRTYLFDQANRLYGCGINYNGEVGVGHAHQIKHPLPVKIMQPVQQIICNDRATFFIGENKRLYACGENIYGDFNSNYVSATPKLCKNLENVAIAKVHPLLAANFYISELGIIYASGYNKTGCLGFENDSNREYPTRIALPKNVTFKPDIIVYKDRSTFFMSVEGDCYACGENLYDRLGVDHADVTIFTPLKVNLPNNKRCLSVFPQEEHTLFMDTEGGLYYTGQMGALKASAPTAISPDELKTLPEIALVVGLNK